MRNKTKDMKTYRTFWWSPTTKPLNNIDLLALKKHMQQCLLNQFHYCTLIWEGKCFISWTKDWEHKTYRRYLNTHHQTRVSNEVNQSSCIASLNKCESNFIYQIHVNHNGMQSWSLIMSSIQSQLAFFISWNSQFINQRQRMTPLELNKINKTIFLSNRINPNACYTTFFVTCWRNHSLWNCLNLKRYIPKRQWGRSLTILRIPP